jgi:membrane protein
MSEMTHLATLRSIVVETVMTWDRHETPSRAAAVSFYLLLSLSPILILAIAVLGLLVGHADAQSQIFRSFQHWTGVTNVAAVQALVEHAWRPSSGIIPSAIAGVALVLGASGVLVELRLAMNLIWETRPPGDITITGYLKRKAFALLMLLVLCILMFLSLLADAALSVINKFFSQIAFPFWRLSVANALVSLLGLTIVFALIFMYVPERRNTWRDVWQGALTTALLFEIGKAVIGIYLGRGGTSSFYGAVGSLVALLMWIFYSAQIFFIGAEFTATLARRGRKTCGRP